MVPVACRLALNRIQEQVEGEGEVADQLLSVLPLRTSLRKLEVAEEEVGLEDLQYCRWN